MVLLAPLIVAAALADAPWHLPGWKARAEVAIAKPAAEPGVDTAAVRVLTQGDARADGADLRVVAEDGSPVPFQVLALDAPHACLLAFRAADPKARVFVYFHNPDASPAPERITADPAPGAGPPKGAWVPRQGLVYETRRRPEGDNPRTVADLAKLLAASPESYGARIQRKIADGYNPFGPSDNYLSIYKGWIRIPKSGTYRFCTVSNEASFSFVDGKELVHWPGRHTIERGQRGEKNASVDLAEGLHYIEYYHEEVTLQQMAYLGWRTDGGDGPFESIPESVFTAPHQAEVTAYASPDGPLVRLEPSIVGSIWPADRHEGQYTAAHLRAVAPGLPKETAFRWDLGDGLTAAGAEVDHIYLVPGRYSVTLTAEGPAGKREAHWPLNVFEIEHVTDQFPEGTPAEYARIAKGYDRAKLDADGLKELAFLLAEADDPKGALEAAREYLGRSGGAKPAVAARVRGLVADCMLKLGEGSPDEAIAAYRAAITKETPPVEALDRLARLIRIVGIERDQPDKTADVLAQVEEIGKAARLDDDGRAAYRRAIVAAGDVLLWHGKLDAARGLYKKAEAPELLRIPPQVRAARVGAYPNAIREFLAAGDTGAALDVVDRWEETFPTDKPAGQTLFWRGKVLQIRGQHRDAARYLARAAVLAGGAGFETEARLLLAEALEGLGRRDEARKELAKLVSLQLNDPFVKKARAKLEKEAGK